MKIRKLIALLMVLAMTFALLTACTPKPVEPGKDPSKSGGEETTEYPDYEDEAFYWLLSIFPKALRDYSDEERAEYEANPKAFSAVDEAKMDNVLRTEKKYNCRVIASGLFSEKSAELVSFFAGGDIPMDFIYYTSALLRDLYFAGVVADLTTVDAIDLSDHEKWGSESSLELVQYKGAQFGIPYVGSLYWPSINTSFNGVLMQSLDAMKLYENDIDWTVDGLIETGDWTWETFLNILPEVCIVEADEKSTKHSFSLTGIAPSDVAYSAIFVNEGSIVKYDEELEKYRYAMLDDNVLEAIQFTRDLFAAKGADEEGMQAVERDRILTGDYTFFATSTNRALEEIAALTSDCVWVPFPYGPHSIYGQSTASFNYLTRDCVSGIFVGCQNDQDPDAETQKNGVIFNDLLEPTETYGKNGYSEWMAHNLFANDGGKSFNVYKSMSDSIHNSWADVLGETFVNSVKNKLLGLIALPTKSVTETLGTFEDPANNALDLEFDQ